MPEFAGTFWALLPPVIAIALALLTKEVYVSLLIGILSGALLYNQFHILDALETTFYDHERQGRFQHQHPDFPVLLGMLVSLMSKSGASRAYGDWASRSIGTRRGASFATAGWAR